MTELILDLVLKPFSRSLPCDIFIIDEPSHMLLTNGEGCQRTWHLLKIVWYHQYLTYNPRLFSYRAVVCSSHSLFLIQEDNQFNRLPFMNLFAFIPLVEIFSLLTFDCVIFDCLLFDKMLEVVVYGKLVYSFWVFDLIIYNILKSYVMLLVIPMMMYWFK